MLPERPQVFSFQQRLHTGSQPTQSGERHHSGQTALRQDTGHGTQSVCRTSGAGHPYTLPNLKLAGTSDLPSNSEAGRAASFSTQQLTLCPSPPGPLLPKLDPDTHSSPLAPQHCRAQSSISVGFPPKVRRMERNITAKHCRQRNGGHLVLKPINCFLSCHT